MRITCTLNKEQIGLLIAVSANYMRTTEKYNVADILKTIAPSVGDDIIQYAAILPKVVSQIITSNPDVYRKGHSIDKYLDLYDSFKTVKTVENYLYDQGVVEKPRDYRDDPNEEKRLQELADEVEKEELISAQKFEEFKEIQQEKSNLKDYLSNYDSEEYKALITRLYNNNEIEIIC